MESQLNVIECTLLGVIFEVGVEVNKVIVIDDLYVFAKFDVS